MELIRGRHNLRPHHRGCVATIGNFDGVHLGHQAVLAALRDKAQDLDLPATVILFEPQPLEYLRPEAAPSRLTRLREKLVQIRRCGIDRVLLLGFDQRLAALEAEDFVDRILVAGLGVRHLYVGDDFRFGAGRRGDFKLLGRLGQAAGFGVESLATVTHQGERVSSTRIRRALAAGDLAAAEACLGRPYALVGRVGHGHRRGRTIGFPTLNIALHRRVSPLQGVFAVKVAGLADQPLPGVANLGVRPTVGGDLKPLLEVHLFDFDQQVYGRLVEVTFVEFIREERKFESFDQLRRQIELDAAAARRIHGLDPVAAII